MSAPEHVTQARQRGQRRRDRLEHGRPPEPGSFRVRDDTNPEFRVAIEVSYSDAASADTIRTKLTEAYGVAITELAKRFK